jgi:hypothetical protein
MRVFEIGILYCPKQNEEIFWSELTPSQNFLFLWEHYRTDMGLICPPEEKFVSPLQRILLFQHSQFVTARQFSQLLGFLNSLAVKEEGGSLLPSLERLEASVEEDKTVEAECGDATDASNLGWGAYLEGSWALGLWFPLQQKEHINLLEMKAVDLALSHLRTTLHLKSLVLATDNTTGEGMRKRTFLSKRLTLRRQYARGSGTGETKVSSLWFRDVANRSRCLFAGRFSFFARNFRFNW